MRHRTDTVQTDQASNWLKPTRLLDLEDPRLRIQALSLTQLATTDTDKARALHDFIKKIPFGCVAAFDHVPAAGVLRAGRGDCHTKGTLFVAMLRSVGVPARLRFHLLSSDFLRGIIEIPDGKITHAVAEILLNGRWIQTDTYVTDVDFENKALKILAKDGRKLGLGLHVDASREWDGIAAAHGQYCDTDPASLPLRDLGVSHDPELFYADTSNTEFRLGALTRLKWMYAAAIINRRVDQLRA